MAQMIGLPKKTRWTVAAAAWTLCALFNWGRFLGQATHRTPYESNTGYAAAAAIVGPFALPEALFGCHHWTWIPLSTEERWANFQHLNPALDRSYFERQYD